MTQTGGLLESGHVKAEAWSYLGGAGGTQYFTQSLETIYWGVLSHSPSGFPPLISKSGGEYSNYRAGSGKKHALGAKSPSLQRGGLKPPLVSTFPHRRHWEGEVTRCHEDGCTRCPLPHRRLVAEGKERSQGNLNVSRFTLGHLDDAQGYLHINPSLPQGCKRQRSRSWKSDQEQLTAGISPPPAQSAAGGTEPRETIKEQK